MENAHWIQKFQSLLNEKDMDIGKYSPKNIDYRHKTPIQLDKMSYRHIPFLSKKTS